MKASDSDVDPALATASITLRDNVFTLKLVTLHDLEGSNFLRIIVKTLAFKKSFCRGIPG